MHWGYFDAICFKIQIFKQEKGSKSPSLLHIEQNIPVFQQCVLSECIEASLLSWQLTGAQGLLISQSGGNVVDN